MPMRARLVVFALLCALPVFLLTGIQLQRETQRIHAAAVHEVSDNVDLGTRRLEEDLVSAETVAQAVGAPDLTKPGAVEACSLALGRAVATAGRGIANFAVVSPAGDVLCSGLPNVLGINVSDRPHVRQALRTGRPALSGFSVGRLSGIEKLQLVVPILDADNHVKAMAIAGLAAAGLVSAPSPVPGLPFTLALFDRAGVLVSRSPDDASLRRGQPFADSELFGHREALAMGPATLRGLDGVPRLYVARAVRFHGETVLWIMSGADAQSLEMTARAAFWRDLGLVLLLALAVSGVAVLSTRPLVLQPHELELRRARRDARVGSWFRDTSGRTEWSEEAFDLLGIDPAVGTPDMSTPQMMLAPGSVEPMTRAYRRLLEEGEPFEVEVEVARPDHKACWLLSRGEAARDASGRIIGARGTVFDITERKLAALAVQRSQHHLRSLIDGLAPSIFVGLLTPEGVIVEANRSPLEAAGIEAQDVLGKPFPEAPWWRGSPQVREQLRAAIVRAAHGEESRYEVQILGRDDEVIDIDFSLQPLRDESGQVIFLIPSAVVITERKRAETALRASESELRALADAMPQIVWISGPDGWNTYMNRRWTDYTGRSAADGAGFAWQKCVHPDDRLRLRDSLQVAGGATSTFLLECRLLGADGAYRWWLLRSEPQYDADGRLLKWVGTATDIHDLKLAELEISRANRELEQQKAELRLLFDLMPALILFKDRENRILRINQFGADATGLRVDEIEGKLAQDIYPEIAGAAHLADLEIIRTGLPQMGTVEKFQTRAGDQVWVQRDRVPLRDANGTVIGIIVMAQDITQRKRDQDALRELNADLESRVRDRTAELSLARSQAEEASRAKSDFLAAMSHEIRTPMSGLLGLLELLQLSTLDHDQQSTVGLARDSGNALLAIIDDILDFSKIEANRLELSWAASSVRSVVETACRLHAQVASSKNLLLRFDVAPQVNALLAVDPLRLGQILNNFLNNAIKFTAVGSIEVMVDVVAQREGIQHLRFVVRDTGIGMSTQQLGRLFQPFAQAEASTSTKFGGTGLGLVIARRLAELMGGTVRIDSEPGVGTTLTLLLSLEVCDASAVVPAPPRGRRDLLEALVAGRRSAPSVEDAQAEGTLLLVVDDHATNRLVLVRQLALLGYAALAAGDGQEGLAAWRSHRFGAVITDCNMPVMNGYEMAMAIRREEQRQGLGRTPVIACTANALPAAVDSCVAAGMDDYIVKPADLAEVNQKLERWVPLKGDSPMLRRSPAGFLDRAAAQPLHGMLDLDLLSELSGGSAAGRSEILADFRRVNDLDVACMRSAAAAGDFAQVLASAHRIKGASLMLGAALLSGTCAGVEVAGAAGDPAGLHLAMGRFEMELLRLRDYMEALA